VSAGRADPWLSAQRALLADRPAYFKDFLDNFYNVDQFGGTRISDQAWQESFIVAVSASPYAAHACVDTWLTDFRGDLPKIDVPTLLVHGDADRILPYEAAKRPAGPDREPQVRHRRRRPAQHRLDPPRRCQQGAARVRRRLRRHVRVAALYDIHANLPAPEAVLREVEAVEPDRIVVGGDVVTGAMNAETVDALMALGDRALFVQGNAERWAGVEEFVQHSFVEPLDPG
jgi:hypothetical protein